MSVDTATVKKVASLARIAISDADAERLAPELNNILGWIEQLGEVDTDGAEPMTSAVAQELPFREDVVTDGRDPERVLANAPKRAGNFFVVPKVVE